MLKDYEPEILNHLGKLSVIGDVLSRKKHGTLLHVTCLRVTLGTCLFDMLR